MKEARYSSAATLVTKVARGGIWVFGLRISENVIGLLRIIFVARLLAPADYGLLGIAALVTNILVVFLETGVETALIQHQGDEKRLLNAAWTVQVLRGMLIYAALFVAAPLAIRFFHEPRAVLIIRVFALTQLISGFGNIGVIYFRKELEFHKQAALTVVPECIALAVTIGLAYWHPSVWALVWGALVCSGCGFIISYAVHPYRPRFDFSLAHIRPLLSFGKWLTLFSILGFFVVQGDDMIVGALLGASALGLYQMAYRISNLPATQITHVISQVIFPAYVKLQGDLSRLREAYLRVLQMTTFLAFPVAGGVYMLAALLTRVVMGAQWLAMVPAMQVLCLFGLTRAFTGTTGSVFFAVGKPHAVALVTLVQLGVMMAIIYPLTMGRGIEGTAWSTVIPNFLTAAIVAVWVSRILKCRQREILRLIALPLSATIIMMGVLRASMQVMPSLTWFGLLMHCVIAVAVYVLTTYFYRRLFSYRALFDIGDMIRHAGAVEAAVPRPLSDREATVL